MMHDIQRGNISIQTYKRAIPKTRNASLFVILSILKITLILTLVFVKGWTQGYDEDPYCMGKTKRKLVTQQPHDRVKTSQRSSIRPAMDLQREAQSNIKRQQSRIHENSTSPQTSTSTRERFRHTHADLIAPGKTNVTTSPLLQHSKITRGWRIIKRYIVKYNIV